MKTLDEYATSIAQLEPKLKQTIWPPMTYMMIPSMLEATDKLLAELENDRDSSEEHMALLERLRQLRSDFKRES